MISTNTLVINDNGQVEFPASGFGFGRYGKKNLDGDHFFEADAAASLFGLSAELKKDWEAKIDYGDMSNENGKALDGDHKMHGGKSGIQDYA